MSHTLLVNVQPPDTGAVTCPVPEAQAHGLLDDELPRDEAAAVRRHLAGCARCRAQVTRLARLLQAVRRLPQERAPASLRERVCALLGRRALGRAPDDVADGDA